MAEPMTFVKQNFLDNSSSAEKICSQLDILLAQNQRLENDISQVKVIQSGMNATLDSVQNILMSTNEWSPDVKPKVDDTVATVKGPSGDNGGITASIATSLEQASPPRCDTLSSYRLQSLVSGKSPCISTSLWGPRSLEYLKEFHFGPASAPSVREALGTVPGHKHLTCICQSRNIYLTRICESHPFQACVVIVILASTAFMPYEADMRMSNALQGKEGSDTLVQVANGIFCILFSIEIGLKLAAYQCSFFRNEDWTWNIFDLIIVATAVNDQIQTVVGRQHMIYENLVFLRCVRAVKIVKALRIFRILRFLRELRLLLENIMGSLKSLMWASMLIGMVNFVFGLVFLQASSIFLHSNSEVDAQLEDSLLDLYGSTSRAMLTMYMATTGGMDWKESAEPLEKVGYFYYLLFIVYISFFMFVVSNVVTSMFVDAALHRSSKDAQYLVAEHMRKKEKYLKTVKSIFEGMEKNPDGSVAVRELRRQFQDNPMVAFCEEIEVEPADLEQFFMTLSGNGKRSVDLDTFVVGCIKLRGNAKSADMMEVLIEINKANHGIHSLLKRLRDSPTIHTSASSRTPVRVNL